MVSTGQVHNLDFRYTYIHTYIHIHTYTYITCMYIYSNALQCATPLGGVQHPTVSDELRPAWGRLRTSLALKVRSTCASHTPRTFPQGCATTPSIRHATCGLTDSHCTRLQQLTAHRLRRLRTGQRLLQAPCWQRVGHYAMHTHQPCCRPWNFCSWRPHCGVHLHCR